MRKKDYILATNFTSQIRSIIDKTMEVYKPEISSALAKAEKVLTAAKAVEKFEMEQKNFSEKTEHDMEL